MIKLEHTSVMNFENALRGMRNPMQSYEKADSEFWHGSQCEMCYVMCGEPCPLGATPLELGNPEYCDKQDSLHLGECVYIGKNDLDLARRLVKAGSDERKFLRQIFVSVDVTAPLYWWKEYDTYKVGTVANSTSTMHKIHAKPFSRDDFSCDRMSYAAGIVLDYTIDYLEDCRQRYTETKNVKFWHDMIQLLPSSYNQMRTCTLNYENLINIYYARKAHRLDEWHVYCDWIAGLPYFREICIEGQERE